MSSVEQDFNESIRPVSEELSQADETCNLNLAIDMRKVKQHSHSLGTSTRSEANDKNKLEAVVAQKPVVLSDGHQEDIDNLLGRGDDGDIGLQSEVHLVNSNIDEVSEAKQPAARLTFLKLLMKPRVSRINVCAMLSMHFIVVLQMSLDTGFTTYLLDAEFGITGDRAAIVAGNLGSVGDIGNISVELLIGSAMDLFGRKTITVAGLFVASIAVFFKPLIGSLAGLYVLKLFSSIGAVPLIYSPFPVDYIEK